MDLSVLPDDPLDAAAAAAELGALAPRFDLDVLERCASTSTLLLERAALGAPGGSVVVCREQSAGRGRRGRGWLSEAGGGLTFSLLWRFPAGAAPPVGLSLAVGVAVARPLRALGLERAQLKWPNDVLVDGRKLAGILVELVSGARGAAAVIGIGVNVRLGANSPALALGACDLAGNMAHPPRRVELFAALLRELAGVLDLFAEAGFAAFRDEWMAHDAYAGLPVRLTSEFAEPLAGRCAGVDREGALLLETETGLQRVLSGDVSLRTV